MVREWNNFSRPIGLNWSNFVPECFLYEAVIFFAAWDSKMAAFANTKNSAEHENDNISITA